MIKLKFIFVLVYLGALMSTKLVAGELQVTVEGKGDPMILIPGLTCHGDVWEETVARYKDNYKCHILTLPGFAGNPEVEFGDAYLATMKKLILEYIKKEKIKNPVIVGHSLGGFLALSIAIENPKLASKLVIVDSLPFMTAIMVPGATAESAKPMAENMRQMMLNSDPNNAEVQQRMMLATMITDSADIETALKWGKDSHTPTVAQAMYELYTTDIREDLDKIESPILVMGAWIAYKNYGVTRESTMNNFKGQYAKAKDCQIELSDEGKHFIMWDDPTFFFNQIDKFL